MSSSNWVGIVAFDASHDCTAFSTGLASVDAWFPAKALPEQLAGRMVTHVCLDEDGGVVAFYSVKHIIVSLDGTSRRIQETEETGGMTTGLLIAQMGVRSDLQDNGMGTRVLHSAMKHSVTLHMGAPFKLLVVDAENPSLVSFYEHRGFAPLSNDLRMVMKMSAVRKVVAQLGA